MQYNDNERSRFHMDGTESLKFDLRPERPNLETLEAMVEAERISRDPNVKGYRDINALFEDLDTDE
ncbi:MAG: hypothetical protein FWC47_12985 [Oscillospiraceae bacterium]|nr:hypothetical protein [Oscillospiraceae bacterium]